MKHYLAPIAFAMLAACSKPPSANLGFKNATKTVDDGSKTDADAQAKDGAEQTSAAPGDSTSTAQTTGETTGNTAQQTTASGSNQTTTVDTTPKIPVTKNPAVLPKEQTVTLTQGTHMYFKGDDSKRERDIDVKLPDSIDGYNKIILHFKLSCPNGRCDAWDRYGNVGIYNKDQGNKIFEILRFATPYGIGGQWDLDVTDFAPLLQGQQKLKIFIDTWVGPGNDAGDGWLVDLSLQYIPGHVDQTTFMIVPILLSADIAYGDPSRSPERKASAVPLLGYKSAKLFTLITGHGQGNAQNCAEFCPKKHSIKIGSKELTKVIWRDDCNRSVDQSQHGNVTPSRAGWCPGGIVNPWTEDVTDALSNQKPDVTYSPEAFENTCRPGSPNCTGCVFGTGCDYDGGAHTDPKYYVTSYIMYKN